MASPFCPSEIRLPTLACQLHRRLRDYNRVLIADTPGLPTWLKIHAADEPAPYWSVLASLLADHPPTHCVEIGSGAGDIAVLLSHYAKGSVVAVERCPELSSLCRRKLAALGLGKWTVLNDEYPVRTDPPPDLVVMVNCVYTDRIGTKDAYLERLREWRSYNGLPRCFVVECIDPNPGTDAYPDWVRLTAQDVRNAFPRAVIVSSPTYRPPRNHTAKTLHAVYRGT
jgi:hypothetical protein